MAIEADRYRETRVRLKRNQVVKDLAEEIKSGNVAKSELVHDDGTPRFEFMLGANAEFMRRTSDDSQPRHIGAVAEAIIELWEESDGTPNS